MSTRTIIIGSILAITITVLGILFCVRTVDAPPTSVEVNKTLALPDLRALTFNLEGKTITLHNGIYIDQAEATGVTVGKVSYFGNEAKGDLNHDGVTDAAFLVISDSGGSGTFYYVVAALSTSDGYVGSNAVFLGDRIAPQSSTVNGAILSVNYADRRPDEPLSAPPSQGVSKRFRAEGVELVAVGE